MMYIYTIWIDVRIDFADIFTLRENIDYMTAHEHWIHYSSNNDSTTHYFM